MSVKSVGWAIEQDIGSATKKLILVGICNHDGDGGSWPAKSTLARYAGCSERTVIRLTQELEDEGWITIHKQGGGTVNTRADRRTNLYVVNYLRGDTFCHPVDDSRGDTQRAHGVTSDDHGVTSSASRGDIAVSPEPSLNHPSEPSTANTLAVVKPGDEWDCFWQDYPRKQGKAEARKRWAKMTHSERLEALDALVRWVDYYATVPPQYVPHASTWLNQRRWEDDIPQPARPEPDRKTASSRAAIARLRSVPDGVLDIFALGSESIREVGSGS